jgi:hypothetical protein
VKDLEDLMSDMPNLINLRMDALNANNAEISARLALIDKQVGMIQRDLRDLRGGVTRQLVEQDKLLRDILAKLG